MQTGFTKKFKNARYICEKVMARCVRSFQALAQVLNINLGILVQVF